MEPDFDLRPRFQYIDTNKYDVSSCPQCGYTAMNRYFTHLSTGQVKMIEEGVCHKFKGRSSQKKNRWSRILTKKPLSGINWLI